MGGTRGKTKKKPQKQTNQAQKRRNGLFFANPAALGPLGSKKKHRWRDNGGWGKTQKGEKKKQKETRKTRTTNNQEPDHKTKNRGKKRQKKKRGQKKQTKETRNKKTGEKATRKQEKKKPKGGRNKKNPKKQQKRGNNQRGQKRAGGKEKRGEGTQAGKKKGNQKKPQRNKERKGKTGPTFNSLLAEPPIRASNKVLICAGDVCGPDGFWVHGSLGRRPPAVFFPPHPAPPPASLSGPAFFGPVLLGRPAPEGGAWAARFVVTQRGERMKRGNQKWERKLDRLGRKGIWSDLRKGKHGNELDKKNWPPRGGEGRWPLGVSASFSKISGSDRRVKKKKKKKKTGGGRVFFFWRPGWKKIKKMGETKQKKKFIRRWVGGGRIDGIERWWSFATEIVRVLVGVWGCCLWGSKHKNTRWSGHPQPLRAPPGDPCG